MHAVDRPAVRAEDRLVVEAPATKEERNVLLVRIPPDPITRSGGIRSSFRRIRSGSEQSDEGGKGQSDYWESGWGFRPFWRRMDEPRRVTTCALCTSRSGAPRGALSGWHAARPAPTLGESAAAGPTLAAASAPPCPSLPSSLPPMACEGAGEAIR